MAVYEFKHILPYSADWDSREEILYSTDFGVFLGGGRRGRRGRRRREVGCWGGEGGVSDATIH